MSSVIWLFIRNVVGYVYVYVFIVFKLMTAYDLRISDWSSDVCSSDLAGVQGMGGGPGQARRVEDERAPRGEALRNRLAGFFEDALGLGPFPDIDRKRGVKGKRVPASVGIGGSRIIKNNNMIRTARDSVECNQPHPLITTIKRTK